MIHRFVKFFILLISVFLLNFGVVYSQFDKIGFPVHKNFERSEYRAGLQSWMISQAPDGLIYFANNEGLMEFDGLNWQLYTVPNKTTIRSVYADDTGRIYIGSSNELGYFENAPNGEFQFISLTDLVPSEHRNFGEIWKIYKTDRGIIFQSYKQLIIYNNSKTEVITAPNFFHFSFYVNNNLYITDNERGIYILKAGKPVLLDWSKELIGKEISSIISYNENLLIATTDFGVFIYDGVSLKKWETTISETLKGNQIYCALRLDEKHIAFGTIQNGLLVSTNEGETVLSVNQSTGLQNNTILCMQTDSDNNLWLGTDNGIDLLMINSPLRQLNNWQNLSAGYAAAVHEGVLYLGTNRGLFYKKWDECSKYPGRISGFEMIESLKGQVWKLQVIDDELFCGHNNGTYIVNGTQAEKISDIPGAWIFLKPSKVKDKIIGGTYTCLTLYEKKNGKWTFSKKIPGFQESSRIMEFDENEDIWMSHVFKGAYRIKLNATYDSIYSVKFYDTEKGFKTKYGINVSKLDGQIVFLTPDGIYQFDESSDKMIPSKMFNEFFSEKPIKHAVENKSGDVWYFSEDNVAVNRLQEDGSYTTIEYPFKPLEGSFIGQFQFVFPINRDNVLFGNENGFINYEPNQVSDYQRQFNVFFSEIKLLKNDSLLFAGHMFKKSSEKIDLKYKDNSIHFFFSAVTYAYPEKNQFSTYLKGYDKVWSSWEDRLDREITDLKEGDYAFYVKAKNIYDVETIPLVFEFKIQAPWYRTTFAYIIYIILIILIILFALYLLSKRIEKLRLNEEKLQRQKYLEKEKELQREALIAEKELIKLRNEKLRQEMKTKNKELADSTMQKIQKNKFLINLKIDLNKISLGSPDNYLKSKVKKVIRKIDSDINNEDNWKVFENSFSDVHEEFLSRLKDEFPDISPAELRLCACLRMNISTKDIAGLLNISIRGVEASRYRLRKTLRLERKTNLTDFVLSY